MRAQSALAQSVSHAIPEEKPGDACRSILRGTACRIRKPDEPRQPALRIHRRRLPRHAGHRGSWCAAPWGPRPTSALGQLSRQSRDNRKLRHDVRLVQQRPMLEQILHAAHDLSDQIEIGTNGGARLRFALPGRAAHAMRHLAQPPIEQQLRLPVRKCLTDCRTQQRIARPTQAAAQRCAVGLNAPGPGTSASSQGGRHDPLTWRLAGGASQRAAIIVTRTASATPPAVSHAMANRQDAGRGRPSSKV